MDDWSPGVIYMRHLDKKGGSNVQMHSCWSTSRFITSAAKAALDEGGSVEVVTEAEYRAANWRHK